MKILSVMSLVLSVALLAGIGFLTLEFRDTATRLDELEAKRAKDTRELSNAVSTAFTRIGELETEVRGLSDQLNGTASKVGLDASVEDLIETKLAEREALRREKQAQQRRDWQDRRDERELNKLVKTLQLNGETEEKMNDILAQMHKERREFFVKLREGGNFGRDKIREGMAKIDAETDEAVKKILTEEQFGRYQETQKRNRKRWERLGGGRQH